MTEGGYTPQPPSRKHSPSSPRMKKKKPPPKKKGKRDDPKGGVLKGSPPDAERRTLGGRQRHSSMRDPSPLSEIEANSSGWRAAAERSNKQDSLNTLNRSQEVPPHTATTPQPPHPPPL